MTITETNDAATDRRPTDPRIEFDAPLVPVVPARTPADAVEPRAVRRHLRAVRARLDRIEAALPGGDWR